MFCRRLHKWRRRPLGAFRGRGRAARQAGREWASHHRQPRPPRGLPAYWPASDGPGRPCSRPSRQTPGRRANKCVSAQRAFRGLKTRPEILCAPPAWTPWPAAPPPRTPPPPRGHVPHWQPARLPAQTTPPPRSTCLPPVKLQTQANRVSQSKKYEPQAFKQKAPPFDSALNTHAPAPNLACPFAHCGDSWVAMRASWTASQGLCSLVRARDRLA